MIFVRKTRAEVCRKYPSMHALQVMKEVGKIWQNLAKEEKEQYELQAQEDKLRFVHEMEQFEVQLYALRNHDEKATQIEIVKEASASDSKSLASPKLEPKKEVMTIIQNKDKKKPLKQIRKRNRSNEAVGCLFFI